jgi:wyosine [tRNA(Phe)-imidazoG37] synthetase (radical SAM superfamily)
MGLDRRDEWERQILSPSHWPEAGQGTYLWLMDDKALVQAHSHHPHRFGAFVHAYPVLSRRAGGISLGVNLNVDKACNFDCPYCQVDRRIPRERIASDPVRVREEITQLLDAWEEDHLQSLYPDVAREHLRLNDVALSGDGESTMDPGFPGVCNELAHLQSERAQAGKTPFRLVLISNATMLDRPAVQAAVQVLCRQDGEVWGKLDAGTQDFYQIVNASRVPLDRIESNLSWAAANVPLRIQTLFFRFGELVPDEAELSAWLDRLDRICQNGPVRSVQLHTVARQTAKSGCHPLPVEWLQELAIRVSERTGVVAECFAGVDAGAIGESR